MRQEATLPSSFAFEAGTAPAFWLVETLWSVLASGTQTDNRLGFMEQVMGSGLGPPTHRHPHATEGFYILDGICRFNVVGTSVLAGPGTLVHLPRLLPHSFSVESAEARVLNFYSPSCFEIMIMACGRLAPERRRPTMPESAPPDSVEQIRLLSDLYGQEAVTALPFLQPSTPELMQTSPSDRAVGEAVIVTANDVDVREVAGLETRQLVTFEQTGGTHQIVEVRGLRDTDLPASTGQAQALYVLEGQARLVGDKGASTFGPGSFLYRDAGKGSNWEALSGLKALIMHLST